jgi:hypothetical protein
MHLKNSVSIFLSDKLALVKQDNISRFEFAQ